MTCCRNSGGPELTAKCLARFCRGVFARWYFVDATQAESGSGVATEYTWTSTFKVPTPVTELYLRHQYKYPGKSATDYEYKGHL